MAFEISRVDVWAGELGYDPQALARQLETLEAAGLNLEFAIVRPSGSKPGNTVLFLAPVKGPAEEAAAQAAGLHRSEHIHCTRIMGPDRPGLLAEIARCLGDAGLVIEGLSAASIRDGCVLYLRCESKRDADRAAELLATTI